MLMARTTLDDDAREFERERWLVERLKRTNPPDSEAWKELLVEYRPILRQRIHYTLMCYHLPADRMDDIEQKTWVTVYTRIHEFVPQRRHSLRKWLDNIQFNHIRNHSREVEPLSFDAPAEQAGAELAEQVEDTSAANPEHELISRETRREILSALDLALQELAPRDREIVLRRLLRKENVDQLAKEYQLQPQTIYQITSNTKKKLRNYLLAPDLFFRVQAGKETRTWKK